MTAEWHVVVVLPSLAEWPSAAGVIHKRAREFREVGETIVIQPKLGRDVVAGLVLLVNDNSEAVRRLSDILNTTWQNGLTAVIVEMIRAARVISGTTRLRERTAIAVAEAVTKSERDLRAGSQELQQLPDDDAVTLAKQLVAELSEQLQAEEQGTDSGKLAEEFAQENLGHPTDLTQQVELTLLLALEHDIRASAE